MSPSQADQAAAVVVCGAGAAGLSAAFSAARSGTSVLLLEASDRLGGTVTGALIHTLGGLYDSQGQFINDGLPRELAERLIALDPRTHRRKMGRMWVLQVCPDVYGRAVTEWIADEPRITVCSSGRVVRAFQSDRRVTELAHVSGGKTLRIRPAAVIDATGTAEVVRLLDESLVCDDGPRAAGGWIVRVRGVARGAMEFPKGLAVVRALREAAASGLLPWQCAHAWIDSGIDPDEAFIKLFVPLEAGWRDQCSEISHSADQVAQAVVEFLRQWPDFARIAVVQSGTLGVRDGGRIRGRYTLTASDVRECRTFADAVCRCAWPIEYWDPRQGVSMEYLPAGSHYEIPMRALQLDGIDNLWVVGKCLSADRLAHASARVVGTCWAMGQAAGRAAARVTHASEIRREPVRAVS